MNNKNVKIYEDAVWKPTPEGWCYLSPIFGRLAVIYTANLRYGGEIFERRPYLEVLKISILTIKLKVPVVDEETGKELGEVLVKLIVDELGAAIASLPSRGR